LKESRKIIYQGTISIISLRKLLATSGNPSGKPGLSLTGGRMPVVKVVVLTNENQKLTLCVERSIWELRGDP